MKRSDLEHVIAAAAKVCEADEFMVVGSQAILGAYPDPPAEMLVSLEADMYPRDRPEVAMEIDGSLGDGSQFHVTHGYFAHSVGPETATFPGGWEDRLIVLEIPPRGAQGRVAKAYFPEPHDLILSKCAAGLDRGHERDWEYVEVALEAGVVNRGVLLERVSDLPVSPDDQRVIEGRIRKMGKPRS